MTTSLHSDILKQFSQADTAIEEVRAAAEYLMDLMRNIHGGTWRVQIDHQVGLIVIVRRPGQKAEGHR